MKQVSFFFFSMVVQCFGGFFLQIKNVLKREVAIGTGIPWTSLLAVLVIVREYMRLHPCCATVSSRRRKEGHTHTHTEKRAAQNIPPAVSNEGPKFVRARYLSLQHRMVKFEHEAQALRAS